MNISYISALYIIHYMHFCVSRQVATLSKPNFHTSPYSSFCISYSSLIFPSTCDFIYNDLSKYVYQIRIAKMEEPRIKQRPYNSVSDLKKTLWKHAIKW